MTVFSGGGFSGSFGILWDSLESFGTLSIILVLRLEFLLTNPSLLSR